MNYRNKDKTGTLAERATSEHGLRTRSTHRYFGRCLGFCSLCSILYGFCLVRCPRLRSCFLEKVLASMAAFWLRFHNFPLHYQI